VAVAAPRRYSDEQREAMYRLYVRGNEPTAIARMCAAGEAGVPAFDAPARSVHSIVTSIVRAKSQPPPDPESDPNSTEALEDRLRNVIKREVEHQEALAIDGKADGGKLRELGAALKTLRTSTPRPAGNGANGAGAWAGNGTAGDSASPPGQTPKSRPHRLAAEMRADGNGKTLSDSAGAASPDTKGNGSGTND
jgi:hypothetical protein